MKLRISSVVWVLTASLAACALSAPLYTITSPKNGDRFHVGDTVTIEIVAGMYQTCNLQISMDVDLFPLPKNAGFASPFDPKLDSIVRFIIPPFFVVPLADSVGRPYNDTVSTVYDSCQILLSSYNSGEELARTAGFYQVLPKVPQGVGAPLSAAGVRSYQGRKGIFQSGSPVVHLPAGIRGFMVYTMAGKQVWHYACAGMSTNGSVRLPAAVSRNAPVVVRFVP